jgi:S1-C subfamily serine protease
MPVVLRHGRDQIVLRHPRSRLGRSPQCEHVIPGGPDSVVSWEHVCVEVTNGLVVVSDLGSTNGTYVNGVKLEPQKRIAVTLGDRIRFGQKGPELVVEAIDLAPVAPVVLVPPPVAPPPPPPPPEPVFVRQEVIPRAEPVPTARRPVPSTAQARRASGPTNTQLHREVEHLHGQGRTVMLVAVVGVAVCLLAVGLVIGISYLNKPQPAPPPPTSEKEPPLPPPPTPEERYDRLMKSAVWVETEKVLGGLRYTGRGSGCLIQSGSDKLVLTAAHVVEGADKVFIAFPRKKVGGDDWERDPKAYRDNKWQIPAEVVRKDKKVDLAVLRLKETPPDAIPLRLAEHSPKVSDPCLTIGNQSPADGVTTAALWAFKKGEITQLDYQRMTGLGIETWMIQSSILINQGDSGGALVNDKDEVIGVNSCGLTEKGGVNLYRFQVEWRVVAAFVAGKPLPGPPTP